MLLQRVLKSSFGTGIILSCLIVIDQNRKLSEVTSPVTQMSQFQLSATVAVAEKVPA
jgi:hypothetical protein